MNSRPKNVCFTLTPECDQVVREIACMAGISLSETVEMLIWEHSAVCVVARNLAIEKPVRTRSGRPKKIESAVDVE